MVGTSILGSWNSHWNHKPDHKNDAIKTNKNAVHPHKMVMVGSLINLEFHSDDA
jgi:hypothetical protein